MASEDREGRAGGRRVAGAPLSTREREILGLLAGGVSGAQIAESLVLSPETVRTHIRNAMAKLGASSRAQAVALAVKRQEIEPHAEVADGQPKGSSSAAPAVGGARRAPAPRWPPESRTRCSPPCSTGWSRCTTSRAG